MDKPTTEHLAALPELATMAILDAALDTVSKVINAVYQGDQNWTPAREAADVIQEMAGDLRGAIEDYTATLNSTRPIPFDWDSDCPF